MVSDLDLTHLVLQHRPDCKLEDANIPGPAVDSNHGRADYRHTNRVLYLAMPDLGQANNGARYLPDVALPYQMTPSENPKWPALTQLPSNHDIAYYHDSPYEKPHNQYPFQIPQGNLNGFGFSSLDHTDPWPTAPSSGTPSPPLMIASSFQNTNFPSTSRIKGCKERQQCSICAKSLSRPADLQRHERTVHKINVDRYFCDSKDCKRLTNSFSRKDHYTEHLRQAHNANIPKRRRKGASR